MALGLISFGGIGSGLPVNQMIDALVQAKQAQQQPLQTRQTQLTQVQAAWLTLASPFSALQAAVQGLSDPANWQAQKISSGDASVVTAALAPEGPAPVAGTYTVAVSQLAQAASVTYRFSGETLGFDGTFQVGNDGTQPLTVQSSETVEALADAINASHPGISAAVIHGSDGTYLVLTNDQTGASAGPVDASGNLMITWSSPVGDTVPTPFLRTAGQDAQALINGIAVTSATNTFSNVLQGVSFTAQSTGTTTLTVTSDLSKPEAALNSFIQAYNALVQAVDKQASYDASTQTAGPLFGDTVLQGILDRLSATILGSGTSGTGITSLAQLGIVFNRDGTLGWDTTSGNSANAGQVGLDGKAIFESAWAADPQAVQSFFGVQSIGGLSPTAGFSGSLYALLDSVTRPMGTLAQVGQGLDASLKMVNDQLATFQDQLNAYKQRITAQLNAMDLAVARYQQMGSLLVAQFPQIFGKSSSSGGSFSSASA
ncbi:MAG: flagellar filament capping protein FliD [Firmicutes bacterium]|nr:flagellar filament capping protein FliD [Bacillota bacterium]